MSSKEVKEFIEKALDKEDAWAQEFTFTDQEQTATKYFYQRLRAIYGASKFMSTFPTKLDLQISRREYARRIGQHSRAQLDFALDNAKSQMEAGESDFMWPNVAIILSGLTLKNTPSHRLLKAPKELTPEEREKSKEKGIEVMRALRESL